LDFGWSLFRHISDELVTTGNKQVFVFRFKEEESDPLPNSWISIHPLQVLRGVKAVLRDRFNTFDSWKLLIQLGFKDVKEELLRC
jgi:hypothetical protein